MTKLEIGNCKKRNYLSIYRYLLLFLPINSNKHILDETKFATGNDLLMLFAQRVKEYRLAAQLSQKELAELSGVSQATISHFE